METIGEMLETGAEVASREFNVKVDFTSASDESDIDGQISLVNAAIERKIDTLILSPSDCNSLASVTQKAINNKIPVLIIDSKLNNDKTSSYITTDNVKAGKLVQAKSLFHYVMQTHELLLLIILRALVIIRKGKRDCGP